MAIIQAPADALTNLPQNLLTILINKQRLEQAGEEQKLRKAGFTQRQEEFAFEKQEREEKRALATGRVNQVLRAAQDPTHPNHQEALQVIQQSPLGAAARGGQGNLIAQLTQGLGHRGTPGALAPIESIQERVREQALLDRIGQEASKLRLATEAAQAGAPTSVTGELVAPGRAEADLTAVELRNEMQAILNTGDPRAPQALTALTASQGTLNWGEIKSALGITREDNIPDDFRMPAPTGVINANQVRAKTFVPLLKEAAGNINQLSDAGIRVTLPSTFIQGSKNATIRSLISSFQDPRQQAFVQANSAFGDFYRFSLSGQQSGEAERISMLLSITEQFGDQALVIANKRKLRQVMIATQEIVANGGMTPLEAIDQALEVVRTQDNDDFTAAFEDVRSRILENEPSNIPGMGNRTNRELIDAGLTP